MAGKVVTDAKTLTKVLGKDPADFIAKVNKLQKQYNFLFEGKAVANLTGKEFSQQAGKPLRTQVLDFFNSFGNKVKSVFGEVLLDQKAIITDLEHGNYREKAAAFKAIPEILKNGIEIKEWGQHHKGETTESGMIAAPIVVDGKEYIGVVTVRGSKNRMYVHDVYFKEKVLADSRNSGNSNPTTATSANTDSSNQGKSSPAIGKDAAKVLKDIVTSKNNPLQLIETTETKEEDEEIIEGWDIDFLRTADGTIFGATYINPETRQREYYINPEHLNAETLIHETYHPFDSMMSEAAISGDAHAKAAITALDKLAKEQGYLERVQNNKSYASKTLAEQQAEARTQMVGEVGNAQIEKSFYNKLKTAVSDAIQWIANKFGVSLKGYTPEQVLNLKLNDLVKASLGSMRKGEFDGKDSGGIRKQIIGEQGAENIPNVKANLEVARQMETAGKTPKEIWLATGWERTKDNGKWKYDLPDLILNFSEDAFKTQSNSTPKIIFNTIFKNGNILHDVIYGHELFKAYPQLETVRVFFDNLKGSVGYWDKKNNQIVLSKKLKNKSEIKSVIIHEIQHAIQDIEGFARGGSINQFRNWNIDKLIADNNKNAEVLKNLIKEGESKGLSPSEVMEIGQGLIATNNLIKLQKAISEYENAPKLYRRLAGEVEARNAEKRLTMTEQERKAQMLSETEDVAEDSKIYIYGANEVQNSIDNNAYESQLQSIKDEAIKNGTFMKAPNGKPTNLNERQWLQVRTKEFKDWFGDWENDPENASKVVDENGEPLVVAHSTNKSFSEFINQQENDSGWLGSGFYFFGDRSLDGQYGKRVMDVFLNIRNPYYATDSDNMRLADKDSKEVSREFTENRKEEGYDGVYYNGNLNQEWVAFSPSQIKSSTDNVGTFSSDNNNILFQKGNKTNQTAPLTAKEKTSFIGKLFGKGLAKSITVDEAKMRADMEQRFGKDFAAAYEKNASIASQVAKASQFIKDVLDGKIKDGKASIEIPESANRAAEKVLGHKINSHRIKADEVRHINNMHGIDGEKLQKNSIPLTKEDIALAPYIMGSPDRVVKGNPTTKGAESVRYYKDLENGYVVVVEREVSAGNTNMENVTMWAEKSRSTNDESATPKRPSSYTSETSISQSDRTKILKDFEDATNPLRMEVQGYHGSPHSFDRFDHSIDENAITINNHVQFLRTSQGKLILLSVNRLPRWGVVWINY
ncbi:MAG: hypothetical protein JSS78_06550 [Bacteroidetes bacterium]|nr:hypothetical protein [Bacteroidota bacterium]